MKAAEIVYLGLIGVVVIFFLMTFYVQTGNKYGLTDQELTHNISLKEYQNTINDAKSTSDSFEKVFKQPNILLSAGYLVVQGIPSIAKLMYSGSIGSLRLVFLSTKEIFAYESVYTLLGIIIAIAVVTFIIIYWDWIRGLIPGSN